MEIKICRFCTLESHAILTLDNRKITPLIIKKEPPNSVALITKDVRIILRLQCFPD